MNREIKFRAWYGKKQKMVDICVIDKYRYEVSFWVDHGIETSAIEEFELMQYTGLKDKNGVEIYEGDILDQSKFPEDDACPYSVVYEYGSFRINYASWVDNIKKPVLDNHRISICDDIVIGNIHENPEILN